MPAAESLSVQALMEQCSVAFGTSGARGEVTAMTDKVCHSYTTGFLQYLAEQGEFAAGRPVALAGDLRPSTPRIMRACAQAIRDMGGVPVNCGFVPTPALALHAFGQGMPSLMVTGSHIPDDRNGIKFYRAQAEVLKADEQGMSCQLLAIATGTFGADGMLIVPDALPEVTDVEAPYVARYRNVFGPDALKGMKIGVYQHSAVGRDVLLAIMRELGAEAVAIARSTTFIPVDTEAIRPEDIALAKGWAAEHGFDAIVSTDGDSDRPLLADHTGTWLRGDVLGVLCAQALAADVVVTPVSSNTALEKCGSFARTARTQIGSPYVIAAMQEALAAGRGRVCGYEANGGFLLASDFTRDGAVLSALPTRDAVLPIVAVLAASRPGRLVDLVASLPQRFTHSDRIKGLPTATSRAILAWLTADSARMESAFASLAGGPLTHTDQTDGLRMTFASGDVIHLRPSGNAPELRCYTEAASVGRAQELCEQALALVARELAITVL